MPRLFLAAFVITAAMYPFGQPQSQVGGQGDRISRQEVQQFNGLGAAYREWLVEDVAYIITNAERSAFLKLGTDDERDRFIEQFWQRRNPEPGSFSETANSFKEEHYRRIAYANEHFKDETPGWRTDRGRIYILWGAPDEIQIGPNKNDQPTATRWQIWRYRYLDGIGENVEFKFVNTQVNGDYQLSTSAELAATISNMPQIWANESFHGTGYVDAVSAFTSVEFKALEAFAGARLDRSDILFSYDFDYAPVTHFTTLVPLTVEVPKYEPRPEAVNQQEARRLNLFCRITDSRGRVVETIYDQFPHSSSSSTPDVSAGVYFLRKSIPLRPDSYDLAIIICDPKSGKIGAVYTRLNVPAMVADE